MRQTPPSPPVRHGSARLAWLEHWLRTSRSAQAADPVVVFAVAVAAITTALPLAGDDPLARQAVAWITNVLMLAVVWLGLRLRGERWERLARPTGVPARPAEGAGPALPCQNR